jgi:hypothetical protein
MCKNFRPFISLQSKRKRARRALQAEDTRKSSSAQSPKYRGMHHSCLCGFAKVLHPPFRAAQIVGGAVKNPFDAYVMEISSAFTRIPNIKKSGKCQS